MSARITVFVDLIAADGRGKRIAGTADSQQKSEALAERVLRENPRRDARVAIIHQPGHTIQYAVDSLGRTKLVVVDGVLQSAHARALVHTPSNWLAWIPSRIIPRRVNDEVVGDAMERSQAMKADGGPLWRIGLLWIYVAIIVVCETVRYAVRSIKGHKAS
jgi:hypothetical protein